MPYANRDNLIADYLPKSTSVAETAAIERLLDNVSAFVDTYCQRPSGYFNASSVDPAEKPVRGEGEHFLRLPVHIFGSITTVKFYGTEIDSANYYESDKNGWLYAEAGFIEELSWENGGVYAITARWGYLSTPLDIQEAVRETVIRLWESQKGTFGQIAPSGFLIERSTPVFAREVLDKYKRRQFEI